MTRLREEWIRSMNANLASHERELIEKTGLDFAHLAAKMGGAEYDSFRRVRESATVAAVSISSGEGVIGSFAESVAGIIAQAGFRTFVTEKCDVDGIYEAYTRGADIVFMADDARYIGMRLDTRALSDNNEATARGYTECLELMAGSLSGREALVIGCGIIGREAGKCLIEKGARPVYYDIDGARLDSADLPSGARITHDRDDIAKAKLIFDATNTGNWLHAGDIRDDCVIVSPGVPYSLDEEAARRYFEHAVHDDLEIGTLAMLGELCR